MVIGLIVNCTSYSLKPQVSNFRSQILRSESEITAYYSEITNRK